jgi:hypothetical protein
MKTIYPHCGGLFGVAAIILDKKILLGRRNHGNDETYTLQSGNKNKPK